MNESDLDRLEDLVMEFLEEKKEDQSLTPGAFSRRHPELQERLEKAIRASQSVVDAVSDASPDLPPNMGEYRMLQEIGRGGMGIVYEAERDGERFALKVLPLASVMGERALERFRRETEILNRLSHPNIVRVRDSGVSSGVPYIVMDLISGEALTSLSGNVTDNRGADLIRTLALAVQSAHDQGVIHRDLKPQNVLIRDDGVPILLDFGLMTASDLPSLTSTGDVLGTPRYMSPEQVVGRTTDSRTDVYGLGLLLYELLTGTAAFSQPSRDLVLRAVSSGVFPRPRRLQGELPIPLEKIILQAMARSPERRYQTAEEMANDLDRFLAHEPVHARPPGPLVRIWSGFRREPIRLVVVALVLLSLSLGIWLFLPSDPALEKNRTEARVPRNPEDLARAGAAVHRGIQTWLDGDRQQAELSLRLALQWNPDDETARAMLHLLEETPVPLDSSPLVRHLTDGLLANEEGEYSEALKSFEKARSAASDNLLATAMQGSLAKELGMFRAAEPDLEKAAAKLPDCFEVARLLGWTYKTNNKDALAIKALEKASELDPTSIQVWKKLAAIHHDNFNGEKGLVATRKAKALSSAPDVEVLTIEGSLLNLLERRAEAQQVLREALAIQPTSIFTLFALALCLDQDHKTKEAEIQYQKILELNPRNERTLTNLAWIHCGAMKNECRECEEYYEQNPKALDLVKSEDYLLRALRESAGGNRQLSNTFLTIGMRLPSRENVLETLDELLLQPLSTRQISNLKKLKNDFRIRDRSPDRN